MAHVRQDGDRVVQAFDKGVAARENGRNRFMTRHFADVSPTNAFFLEIGDLALVAAVAAPHRAEAFAACAELVERIKHEVPIWKRQHFANGVSEWVGL